MRTDYDGLDVWSGRKRNLKWLSLITCHRCLYSLLLDDYELLSRPCYLVLDYLLPGSQDVLKEMGRLEESTLPQLTAGEGLQISVHDDSGW